ncbi:MAG TPA: ANTAR domain-containing protein [Jatrophihabitantaceae bacterium]|nr:ANTAR domain-containing protein [Jatrophihabitantaceae bacterium]
MLATAIDLTVLVAAREAERRRADETAANLQIALASNRRIGTAVGILMARHRITDDTAFDLLRVTSQRTHRKLRDIADDVVLTGALPGE